MFGLLYEQGVFDPVSATRAAVSPSVRKMWVLQIFFQIGRLVVYRRRFSRKSTGLKPAFSEKPGL
jgi:hypothetical protein